MFLDTFFGRGANISKYIFLFYGGRGGGGRKKSEASIKTYISVLNDGCPYTFVSI